MEKLLKWSLEAASNDGSKDTKQPDPELLNQLFGGKDEAQLMKESMQKVLDKSISKDDRMVAFDDLEMLVESLDNANNLEPLKLWQSLIGLLDHPDKDFQKMACWVIGTAVQNNPKSQKNCLDSRPLEALPKLLSLASGDNTNGKDVEVAVKAIYALASEIGHNEEAYDVFLLEDGWKAVTKILIQAETNEKVRIRAFSLLRVLITIEPVYKQHQHFKEANILPTLIDKNLNKEAHPTIRERTLSFLEILSDAKFKFTDKEKKDAKNLIDDLRQQGVIEKDEYTFFD